eukprot:1162019-Pelagomonas_calceolata.AAC.4
MQEPGDDRLAPALYGRLMDRHNGGAFDVLRSVCALPMCIPMFRCGAMSVCGTMFRCGAVSVYGTTFHVEQSPAEKDVGRSHPLTRRPLMPSMMVTFHEEAQQSPAEKDAGLPLSASI